jgi:hypothetical protein
MNYILKIENKISAKNDNYDGKHSKNTVQKGNRAMPCIDHANEN